MNHFDVHDHHHDDDSHDAYYYGRNHHHHHSSSWHHPLFEVSNGRYYCYNLFCPCAVLLKNYNHLLGIDSSYGAYSSAFPSLCSCVCCFMPTCLCVNELIRKLSSQKMDEEQDHSLSSFFFGQGLQEPNQQYSMSSATRAALPVLSMMSEGYDDGGHDPEFVQRVEGYMQGITCLWASIGTLCIVPSVFLMRQTVQQKLGHEEQESIWRTGLISCCAWPCALTQIAEELDYYYAD